MAPVGRSSGRLENSAGGVRGAAGGPLDSNRSGGTWDGDAGGDTGGDAGADADGDVRDEPGGGVMTLLLLLLLRASTGAANSSHAATSTPTVSTAASSVQLAAPHRYRASRRRPAPAGVHDRPSCGASMRMVVEPPTMATPTRRRTSRPELANGLRPSDTRAPAATTSCSAGEGACSHTVAAEHDAASVTHWCTATTCMAAGDAAPASAAPPPPPPPLPPLGATAAGSLGRLPPRSRLASAVRTSARYASALYNAESRHTVALRTCASTSCSESAADVVHCTTAPSPASGSAIVTVVPSTTSAACTTRAPSHSTRPIPMPMVDSTRRCSGAASGVMLTSTGSVLPASPAADTCSTCMAVWMRSAVTSTMVVRPSPRVGARRPRDTPARGNTARRAGGELALMPNPSLADAAAAEPCRSWRAAGGTNTRHSVACGWSTSTATCATPIMGAHSTCAPAVATRPHATATRVAVRSVASVAACSKAVRRDSGGALLAVVGAAPRRAAAASAC